MNPSHLDVVGRAGDVVVPPLDKDDVLAPLPHHVVHRVPPATLVLDHHLVTGDLGAVDAHIEDVVAGPRAVHGEAVGAVEPNLRQAAPCAVYL